MFNDSSLYRNGYYFPEATVIDVEMWDFIDKVVYINLDHRTDRNEHMKQVTKTFGDKVIRFSAIKHDNGSIGCSMSHIEVLKIAIRENWDNILVLEDDVQWNSFEGGYQILKKLASNPYDVIMLGGSFVSYNQQDYKLASCNTTTAFLVNRHYMQTLLSNFEESLFHLIREPNMAHYYALDQYFMRLQKKDNWYIVQPPLMYQIPNHSDTVNRFMDYREYMNVPIQPVATPNFILKRIRTLNS